jgi:hypothetical protein
VSPVSPVSSVSPVLLAHGVGERGDLPVPFALALNAAVAALVLSFVILGYAWKSPRWAAASSAGRALPAGFTAFVDSRGFRLALRLLGVLLTLYVGAAALFGPDLLVNPTFGVVYVLFWVGLVPMSLLFGPVWRFLNPLRAVHRAIAWALRLPPEKGLLPFPSRLGYWPAVVGLFAFVWLELVAPDNATLPVVRLWFALYAVAHLMAATLYGSRWFDKGDAFEVYSALFGRLSVLGRRAADRRLVLRNPLANLASVSAAPGLVAVIAVMLGSTGFDGFSQSPWWTGYVQTLPLPSVLVGSVVLLGFVLFVAVTFWGACRLAGGLGGVAAGPLPGLFAASVVPIALGYVVAHYFTLFVLEGQRTLILLSDPLSSGANVLGLSGHGVATSIADNAPLVALVKVSAVVVGHVLGVIAAHDKAVEVFPRRTALLAQLPLLIVMIVYTTGGLTLLFAT